MLTCSVAGLVRPVGKRRFVEKYWPDRFLTCRGPVAGLAKVQRTLGTVEEIAGRYDEPIKVWFGERLGKQKPRPAGRFSPEQAIACYREGATLYFESAQHWIPELRPMLMWLAADLGLRPEDGMCSIFASRAGAGARMHFDTEVAFNIQLEGRKRWLLAENTHVANPSAGYSTSMRSLGELRFQTRSLPRRMPRTARSFMACPGSVVFLPRGVWHSTKALDDSLALSIGFRCRSYADLVLTKLRERIVSDEAWRELADAPRDARTSVEEQLARLLASLPAELASISADDLLAEHRGPRTPNRRRTTRDRQ